MLLVAPGVEPVTAEPEPPARVESVMLEVVPLTLGTPALEPLVVPVAVPAVAAVPEAPGALVLGVSSPVDGPMSEVGSV